MKEEVMKKGVFIAIGIIAMLFVFITAFYYAKIAEAENCGL